MRNRQSSDVSLRGRRGTSHLRVKNNDGRGTRTSSPLGKRRKALEKTRNLEEGTNSTLENKARPQNRNNRKECKGDRGTPLAWLLKLVQFGAKEWSNTARRMLQKKGQSKGGAGDEVNHGDWSNQSAKRNEEKLKERHATGTLESREGFKDQKGEG